MIVEQRTYTYQPDRTGDFLSLYEAEGMEVQLRHLANMVGYYVTEIGVLNRTVTMWGYEDLADRDRRRRALFENPAWIAFLAKARPLILTQETTVLRPAPFFSNTLKQMLRAQGTPS
ncbi:MAG: NIPSNAP family protein [Betaproteobacteria bacterium]|nr:MAG: NIPSNAP family protein [Betaproteobacteria bacterium]